MPDFTFTDRDHDILDVALTFMHDNFETVNDKFDTDFTASEIDLLREDLAFPDADDYYDDDEDEDDEDYGDDE